MNMQESLHDADWLIGQFVLLLILVGAVWLRSVATRTADCDVCGCNQPAVADVTWLDQGAK